MCLCHQHGIELTSEHQSKKIEVTIYILHARIQFSSQIQITNFIPNALTKTRVFFDSFGDLLLIYIPGQYIQLIDCNPDISPIPTLMTTGQIIFEKKKIHETLDLLNNNFKIYIRICCIFTIF